MSYMLELEARLHLLLENAGVPTEDRAPIIGELKTIVLESYRNGQKAGAPKRRARKTAKAAPAECMYDHDHAQNGGRDCTSHD